MQEDSKAEWREFSVRMPAWLVTALDQCASEDRRSRAGEVLWIVEQYVRDRLAREQEEGQGQ